MYALAERNQVIELVQILPKKLVAPRCSLRGRFSTYANPSLRAKEKDAWALAAEEKHNLLEIM